ncbi:hypothetical protein CSB93_5343 [Pseudomonas paraeruginosa]|uniref:Uncharacterized protein n=1 Tax=Pseudomonas paraeruginosa TaxID=2994495 RepID=A0A2R3ISD0_9PSED|nr:hypothetical protein CSB93_5343 [Pseudomonas paraeruginosa]AWE93511.1 hypothetical protein CSC28_4135 [Pseudomonas paraeruginosa]PTC35271.1 hypothetical protein CLJ1_3971 [Pseudomonas aeruginosa]
MTDGMTPGKPVRALSFNSPHRSENLLEQRKKTLSKVQH